MLLKLRVSNCMKFILSAKTPWTNISNDVFTYILGCCWKLTMNLIKKIIFSKSTKFEWMVTSTSKISEFGTRSKSIQYISEKSLLVWISISFACPLQLKTGGIFDPYFLSYDINVNGKHYMSMCLTFFWPELVWI